uniref:CARD domain-containing protein n=1 Tax=Haplochromis burtoni TaxID=8153 RepID=A0A3Q2XJ33_HAPBU
MKGKKRKKTKKTGSDLLPHGKHKESETKKAKGLLSEPMFDQDQSIPHVKHKQTQTEITGSFLSNTPGDGLKFNHIRRVPKSSHSKYPPSCSLSMTSFVDESAAGSSTASPESEEFVTHSIMKSETMPDDYKLRGTSGSSGLSSRSCLLPCSHSMVSLSKIPRAKNNFTQVNSSPDMLLNEFTPVITDDFDDENYTFQCSCPGLYQCSVTGLVFFMKAEGDVVYRTVPWNRRLLAQHHKKPAGPLFDIKCQQQSVCQLCLPHCELISTGGGQFLQVAHVKDEGIEFITPHKITESHVVINLTGFSGYGIVSHKDSPPDPVQALVLLFYKPPAEPDLSSKLSVLLLPRNIVIRDVQRTRRKLIGDERYIDTSPHCKLHPKQVYTLSTVPEDDLITVEPNDADFDDEYYDSYFTTFLVSLGRILTDVDLSLKDESSSTCVWERKLCLFSPTVGTLNHPPSERLLNTRSCFIEGISEPNLSSLIDKLLEKKVITDAEREAADAKQDKREKARFVIDTVRNKGDAASSEFINFVRDQLCFSGWKQQGLVA